jgi:probable addiction module antidote protein
MSLGHLGDVKHVGEGLREMRISRESLYRALFVDGNPEFATVMRVMRALGLHLRAT